MKYLRSKQHSEDVQANLNQQLQAATEIENKIKEPR